MIPTRIEILGVPIDCVNMQSALQTIEHYLEQNQPKSVIAVNPEKIIKCHADKNLLKIIQQAGMIIPDGIGAVIAARMLKSKKMQRVPGSELMPEICALAERKGKKVFLFGAKPEVNMKAVSNLKLKYPDLNIVGSQDGYLSEEEMPSLVQRINQLETDILFIALGSPAQEIWMSKYLNSLNVKICQGVGGTFDVIAGNVKRAPAFFRAIYLEWFYRLASQPKRLVRQTALPKFVYLVIKQKLGFGNKLKGNSKN